jgi:hypothetical protein
MAVKRTHTNRTTKKFKPGAVLVQPSSPAGKVRTSKGKIANLGLVDPAAPSWRGAPYVGWFGTSREK